MKGARIRTGSLGVLDQTLFSVLNFALAATVAKSSTPSDFGRFALMQAILAVGIAGYRAVPGSWILTLQRGESDHPSSPPPGSIETAALFGMFLTATMLVVGNLSNFPSHQFIVYSVCAPALLIVDAFRLTAYRDGSALHAIRCSGGALMIFITAWLLVYWFSYPTAQTAIDLYSATFLVLALCLASVAPRRRLSVSKTVALWRSAAVEGRAQASSFALIAAAQISVPYSVAAGGGLNSVAGFRGAQTVGALPMQVPLGLQPLLLARAARLYRDQGRVPTRIYALWATIQISIMGSFLFASLFIPATLGRSLLGATWDVAKDALPWIILAALVAQLTMTSEMHFRVVGRMRRMVAIRAFGLLPLTTLPLLGALRYGATGAGQGLFVANCLVLAVALWCLIHDVRRTSVIHELGPTT